MVAVGTLTYITFVFDQSGPSQGETLFVIEALLNCSSKSVKSADGDKPQPCGPDEKGEMQVRFVCNI